MHKYELEPMEEEGKKEFVLWEEDLFNRKWIGLMLQDFIAWEHLKDMIELGEVSNKVDPDIEIPYPKSKYLKFTIKLPMIKDDPENKQQQESVDSISESEHQELSRYEVIDEIVEDVKFDEDDDE